MIRIFSGRKIPSLKKRQDSVPQEDGADTKAAKDADADTSTDTKAAKDADTNPSAATDPSTDTKAAQDADTDPSADSGTSEDGDSTDYDYEDEDSTELADQKTCLGGLPKEYCAVIVEILLFIGLFIGGFIRLR